MTVKGQERYKCQRVNADWKVFWNVAALYVIGSYSCFLSKLADALFSALGVSCPVLPLDSPFILVSSPPQSHFDNLSLPSSSVLPILFLLFGAGILYLVMLSCVFCLMTVFLKLSINPIICFLCIFSREDIWRLPAKFWLATLIHRELYDWYTVNQFIICGLVYEHNVSLIPKFLIRGASFTSLLIIQTIYFLFSAFLLFENSVQHFINSIKNAHLNSMCLVLNHVKDLNWCSNKNMLSIIWLPPSFSNICVLTADTVLGFHTIFKSKTILLSRGDWFALGIKIG